MNVDEHLMRLFWSDVSAAWEIAKGIADGDIKTETDRAAAIHAEALLNRTRKRLEEILDLGERESN